MNKTTIILIFVLGVMLLSFGFYLDIFSDKMNEQKTIKTPDDKRYVRTINDNGITCVIFRDGIVGGIDCNF